MFGRRQFYLSVYLPTGNEWNGWGKQSICYLGKKLLLNGTGSTDYKKLISFESRISDNPFE